MATTAIDRITQVPPSFFEVFYKSKSRIVTFVISLVFFISVQAQDVTYSVGIVNVGAFLLSEDASVKREGNYIHGLVGYLPVGTRVYIEEQVKVIRNLRTTKQEKYYAVLSSIGIKGLLREDLFTRAQDKTIAVVLSSAKIPLHHPDDIKGEQKAIMEVGRYDNAYLKLADNTDNEYILAELISKGRDGTDAEPVSVRLWRQYITLGKVKEVKPLRLDGQSVSFPEWTDNEKLDETSIKQIFEKIKIKFKNYQKTQEILTKSFDIECVTKFTAKAKSRLELLGNGLSFDLDMAPKDYGYVFRLMQRKLNIGSEQRTYLILQNVKCDANNHPEQLHHFTLQEGVNNFGKRDIVRLKDLQTYDNAEWKISLSGQDTPLRMVRIGNEEDYLNILKQLDKFVSHGNSFISELSAEEKEILLNLILREIGHFENHVHRAPTVR